MGAGASLGVTSRIAPSMPSWPAWLSPSVRGRLSVTSGGLPESPGAREQSYRTHVCLVNQRRETFRASSCGPGASCLRNLTTTEPRSLRTLPRPAPQAGHYTSSKSAKPGSTVVSKVYAAAQPGQMPW